MVRRPPRSTLFPTRRSSDLVLQQRAVAGHQGRRGEAEHLPERKVPRHHRQHDAERVERDRKSTRLNSSHMSISYAVFCLKKKTTAEAWSSTRSRIPDVPGAN